MVVSSNQEQSVELELQRLDIKLLKLHPQIQEGDCDAIMAALRVSDRRCKLLGLHNPVDWQIQRGIAAGLQVELKAIFGVLKKVLDEGEFERVLDAIARLQEQQAERGDRN